MTLTADRTPAAAADISTNCIVARVRDIAERRPDHIALREKVFGIWEETTYAEYWEMVQIVGAALLEHGVGAGDTVAIHSENRKAWVWSDLGTQAI